MTLERHDVVNLDRQYVWHPYTSSEDHAGHDPLVIERAEGVWLYDVNTKRYFDANGQWWVNTLGHAHPRLVRCAQDQAARLAHCSLGGLTHAPAALLAQRLCGLAPKGLTKIFFSDNGSTAVETAIKITTQYFQQNGHSKKTRFASMSGAFHGDTVGAMSLGVDSVFSANFGPVLFEVLRPAASNRLTDASAASGTIPWAEVFEAMLTLIEQAHAQLAGVIIEPFIQGAQGMRMWPIEEGTAFLKSLRRLTHKLDVFLIADEVFVGYGRTGSMFACEHAGISPDFLCLSKAFSGGMLPMAATLTTQRIYDGFLGDNTRALLHGHTYCGNPLGAALALEVLNIYADEKILSRVEHLSALLKEKWMRLQSLPGVSNVRSMGMVAALEVGAQGYHGRAGWRVYEAALQRGVYLRPLGDTVYVTPPYVCTDTELNWLVENIEQSLRAVL